ncbi:hypothetical protein QDY71_07460 [Kingella negevensis]|nr:hypothetical protein [Kingella negevensis]MDK4681112.1 hypothetical protein [Kingella negevensis]MDK4683314.1 hypothetical protein [Kingella negevensis]MDK4684320.1 hypothetical protein [Kingella negevensis]MDK4691554.1 hypothetical protein [Kingella negevensis]MDK4693295.1 hypothetical protein [Kingella negevensis]
MQLYRFILLIILVLFLAPNAHAFNSNNSGIFTLLDAKFKPTKMQMRYRLAGKQWHAETRVGKQTWQTLCRRSSGCLLRVSSNSEVSRFKRSLPQAWRKQSFDCIHNSAFAFCKTNDVKKPKQLAYWWFALKPNIHALPLRRVEYIER